MTSISVLQRPGCLIRFTGSAIGRLFVFMHHNISYRFPATARPAGRPVTLGGRMSVAPRIRTRAAGLGFVSGQSGSLSESQHVPWLPHGRS